MDPGERFVELIQGAPGPARLDLMAALLGAAFEPEADVDGVIGELDRLADRCEPTFDSIIATLFGTGPLRGNSADYGDPRNSYLHQVLARGLGIPITLSVCAIEVGRRVGVEVRGVGLPGHFIVAHGHDYADPFHGGRHYSLDELEPAWRRITGLTDPLDGRYLQPAHTRSILVRMLNNLKQTFVAMDDPLPLRTLARLRGAFAELAPERTEHARWMRHWN